MSAAHAPNARKKVREATAQSRCAGDFDRKLPRVQAENSPRAASRTNGCSAHAANRLRLHHMGGNVWQWCEDIYNGDAALRVVRGSGWFYGDPQSLVPALQKAAYFPSAPGVGE